MNFLSPWFLAGALLVVGPIIAHLIRRSTRDRTRFSATRFLSESAPRLQRRSRVQHPLLLLLRCLIVALLAAAFARPFFADPPSRVAPQTIRHDVVIVLDESASMRRADLWKQARGRVLQITAGLQPFDRCTILVASAQATPLLSGSAWSELSAEARPGAVQSLLEAHEPSWGPMHLDTAVDAALDVFAETTEGARSRLFLVSDFALGTRVAGLAGRDWPAGLEVSLERIAAPLTSNAGLHWMGWSETDPQNPMARLRITRDRGALPLPLKLQIFDERSGAAVGNSATIELAPGETRLHTVSLPNASRTQLRAELTGDSESFDNQVWIVPPVARDLNVVYLGGQDTTDTQNALFYLSRALNSARSARLTLHALSPAVSPEAVPDSPLIFVNANLPAPLQDLLRRRLAQGAHVVSLLDSPARVPNAASLSGEIDWTVATGDDRHGLLGKIDFTHPLFSLFADPRFSDFSQVRFWRPVRLRLPAASPSKTVASFDDDSAALVETVVGKGRHLVFASDWNPQATQWVLSTKFIPWLENLVEQASGGPQSPASVELGSALPAPGTARWEKQTNLTRASAASPTVPTEPGIFRLTQEESSRLIAFQVPAEESRTDVLALDAFEQLGMPLRTSSAPRVSVAAATDGNAVATESRQKLWRWLLCLVAAFLAVESALAYGLSRRDNRTPQAAGGAS